MIEIVSEETVEFFIDGLLNEDLPFLIAEDLSGQNFFKHRDIEVEDLLFEAGEEIGFEFSTSGEDLLAADNAISKITGIDSETHDDVGSLSIEAEENTELVLDVLELAQGDILFEDPSANFGREQPAVALLGVTFCRSPSHASYCLFQCEQPEKSLGWRPRRPLLLKPAGKAQ